MIKRHRIITMHDDTINQMMAIIMWNIDHNNVCNMYNDGAMLKVDYNL